MTPENGLSPPQLLVTALFDLEKREKNGRRDIAAYIKLGDLVLGQPLPLVIYCDPELQGRLEQARKSRGLSQLTRVVPMSLEALPLYGCAAKAAALPTFEQANPDKDTWRYQLVNWSKLDLLADCMHAGPFGCEHFAWIDFGIGHVASAPASFPAPSGPVSLLQMKATAPSELMDRRVFMSAERGRLAAGFIRGHRDSLGLLRTRFRQELLSVLADGLRTNEQMLLAGLSVKYPDQFDFYYGDYGGVLSNWDYLRRDFHTVLHNIRHCHDHGLYVQARKIDEVVLASLDRGLVSADEEQIAWFLDMAFLAARQCGAIERAQHFQRLFLANCSATQHARAHVARLSAQFTSSQ